MEVIFYNNFKYYFAAGFDGVSVKISKCIANNIVNPLTYIYNLSIENRIFPDKFKNWQ